jgi:hypothetical protein
MSLIDNPTIINTLKSKAKKSPCTYKVAAIAFDKKGDILGTASNSHSRNWNVLEKCDCGRANTGEHAEQKLFDRYGSNIKTILICRVGHSGILRSIDACPTCQKVAKKFGAKIISIK